MHKIIITDPVRLLNAIDFAQRNHCLDELGRSLCHLIQVTARSMTVSSEGGTSKPRGDTAITVEISYDFAPHSLAFCIWAGERLEYTRPKNVQVVLNGGFIYHGPSSPGDGSAPSFNADLAWASGQRSTHSWSIHT